MSEQAGRREGKGPGGESAPDARSTLNRGPGPEGRDPVHRLETEPPDEAGEDRESGGNGGDRNRELSGRAPDDLP